MSLKRESNITFNGVYNPQEIKWLYVAFENMPFLPQEGRVLHARRACSRMKKRLFYFCKGGSTVDELTSKRVDGLIDSVGEK